MHTISDHPVTAQKPSTKSERPPEKDATTSEIEYTSQYDAFMEKVAEYHQRQGYVFVHSILGTIVF